jgi:hypothetical protein
MSCKKPRVHSTWVENADTGARHKSMIAYLSSSGLPKSAAALREEIDIGEGFDEATSKKYEGLLEKKWTSVVRLQKKVRFRDDPEAQH